MAAVKNAPAPSATAAIMTTMVLAKETKGAVQYQDPSDGSLVPTLYIRKDAFLSGIFPSKIVLHITTL